MNARSIFVSERNGDNRGKLTGFFVWANVLDSSGARAARARDCKNILSCFAHGLSDWHLLNFANAFSQYTTNNTMISIT
jgi:hypothetical protein